MARKRLSEYRSKIIISMALGVPYNGWEVFNSHGPTELDGNVTYVLKVDQAVKGRFKKGLVFLNLNKNELNDKIESVQRLGYESFIIEPYFAHDSTSERYLSLKRGRKGVTLSYSSKGGVDIEESIEYMKSIVLGASDLSEVSRSTGFSREQLDALVNVFDEAHMTLLEINPYTLEENSLHILDVAIEVDDAGELLVSSWTEKDMRYPARDKRQEEIMVQKLNKDSPASFSLEVINPDGAVFLLLSGGGASIVVADEIYSLGYGSSIANYGEYSGNPTEDETTLYTRQVIKLLVASSAPHKVLFIGGAVANFTNIAATFNGVIKALHEEKDALS